MENIFSLTSPYSIAGDQDNAINFLVKRLKNNNRHNLLLGITGSGKTFSVANVIAQYNKPTLVIAHNKTLAAQLYQEYKDFFPHNEVHYFVSYYDFYQPEAYVPVTDTYIAKEAMVNAEIDRLRHATTQALLTRRDCIVVASVSCIYGLGSPIEYKKKHLLIKKGDTYKREAFIKQLVGIFFERTHGELFPGKFRFIGNVCDIIPTNEERIIRVVFEEDVVHSISLLDANSQSYLGEEMSYFVFPAKHFVTEEKDRIKTIKEIQKELQVYSKKLIKEGKILEAERLKRRTLHDISLIREVGYCNGIENYSRFFDKREEDEPPFTLLSYFPHTKDGAPDFLTVIDESHVTVPQLKGMFAGDRARKNTLIEHGFRLPSARDNRPLRFEEFDNSVASYIYTSATPQEYEKELSTPQGIVEQIIRPTGLLDPVIIHQKIVDEKGVGQVQHFVSYAKKVIQKKGGVLATTLTKKHAENLADYLKEQNVNAEYLHSDIKTIERIEILNKFRDKKIDCIIGVNLLREGLDLPEVELIGIFDADKEGFLRSATAIIQTIGRAARNINGTVIVYADVITPSLEYAMKETKRRRLLQEEYNKKHNITPTTVKKNKNSLVDAISKRQQRAINVEMVVENKIYKANPKKFIKQKQQLLKQAVKELDFETAALLRDELLLLEGKPLQKKKITKK